MAATVVVPRSADIPVERLPRPGRFEVFVFVSNYFHGEADGIMYVVLSILYYYDTARIDIFVSTAHAVRYV